MKVNFLHTEMRKLKDDRSSFIEKSSLVSRSDEPFPPPVLLLLFFDLFATEMTSTLAFEVTKLLSWRAEESAVNGELLTVGIGAVE